MWLANSGELAFTAGSGVAVESALGESSTDISLFTHPISCSTSASPVVGKSDFSCIELSVHKSFIALAGTGIIGMLGIKAVKLSVEVQA